MLGTLKPKPSRVQPGRPLAIKNNFFLVFATIDEQERWTVNSRSPANPPHLPLVRPTLRKGGNFRKKLSFIEISGLFN